MLKSSVISKPVQNRRGDARAPIVVLEVKGKAFDKIFVAHADNLGIGGLRLSSNHLKVGDRFPIEFVLPDMETKIECFGEVVWKKEMGASSNGVGVRFVDLSSKAKGAIEKWIDEGERTG
jgi:Tfp pilus assembly protein PilZ